MHNHYTREIRETVIQNTRGGQEWDSCSEKWQVLWKGMSECYGSLTEKLLTHFYKIMEDFCKELISKLILKKWMEVGQEKVLKMEGGEKMGVGAWVWGKF